MPGSDFDEDSGRFSANSLKECVGLCQRHNPQCAGAVWDRNNRQGFKNCWLKRNARGTVFQEATQFARVENVTRAENDCGQVGTTYTSDNDTDYRVLCGINFSTPDVDQRPAQSMAECMDLCSKNDNCAGVTYQADRSNALYNCFLKSVYDPERTGDTSGSSTGVFDSAERLAFSISSSTAEPTTTTLILDDDNIISTASSTTTTSSTIDSNSGDSLSSDKKEGGSSNNHTGAIVGGSVGGVIALALLGLVVFFWKRRQNPKKRPNAGELAGRPVNNAFKTPPPIYSSPAQSPPVEIGSGYAERSELPGQPYR
ncbi:hypothetical protein CC79DRAFT_1222413 [Sarocladium strictum]